MANGPREQVQQPARSTPHRGAGFEAGWSQLTDSFILNQARDAAMPCGQDGIRELVLAIEVLVAQLLEVANELPPGPERARVLKHITWLEGTIAQYGEPVPPGFA